MASVDPASTAWSNAVPAPSKRIEAKAKGWSSGCWTEGSGTQDQDVDRPGRPDLDEIRGQLRPGRRIPLERGHEHPVAAADAEDPLLGQGRS